MSNASKIMPFNLPKNSTTIRNRNRGRRSPSYLNPIPDNRPFPNNRIPPTNTGVAPRLEEPVSVSKVFSGPGSNPAALNAPLIVPKPVPTKPSMFLPNRPPITKAPSKPRPWNNAQTGNDPNKVYEAMKPSNSSKASWFWPFAGGRRTRTRKSRKSRKSKKSKKSRKSRKTRR